MGHQLGREGDDLVPRGLGHGEFETQEEDVGTGVKLRGKRGEFGPRLGVEVERKIAGGVGEVSFRSDHASFAGASGRGGQASAVRVVGFVKAGNASVTAGLQKTRPA